MFGVFLDKANKKIISAEMTYIEIMDALTINSVNCETFKGLSEKEMEGKATNLKELYKEFELIIVEPLVH